MKLLTTVKSFSFSSILALSMAGTFTTASVAQAAPYFSCSSGFTFQVKSGAARCYKSARTVYKPLNRCGSVRIPVINKSIGHFMKRDHQGRKDMCVGTFKVGPVTNTNAVETRCPRGYGKQVRRGTDKCKKVLPAKVQAVTKPVSR